jgi:hypothetical protein
MDKWQSERERDLLAHIEDELRSNTMNEFYQLVCKNQCVTRSVLHLDHCGEWKRYTLSIWRYLSQFVV